MQLHIVALDILSQLPNDAFILIFSRFDNDAVELLYPSKLRRSPTSLPLFNHIAPLSISTYNDRLLLPGCLQALGKFINTIEDFSRLSLAVYQFTAKKESSTLFT